MLKNKNPGFITEHIYRAVRTEGPVIIKLSSLEDRFSLSLWHLLTPIYGILVKKKKPKVQLKLKKNVSKIKNRNKKQDKVYGSTDLE